MFRTFYATVKTLIPVEDVTAFEKVLLREHGFEAKQIGKNYFFVADEATWKRVEAYNFPYPEYTAAKKVPENNPYFKDGDDDLATKDYISIFQNIIKRSPTLNAIEIASVAINETGHDMIGGCCGHAEIITADNCALKSTDELFVNMRNELGLPDPGSQEDATDGMDM